jgi:iron complex transport system ATP-binding protein
MLRLDRLRFSIAEKTILESISTRFESSKIHGVIGPNGSGKSTLLKNMCRIWEPQSGTVLIGGKDYKSISRKDLSKLVTLVPQNSNLSFPISVFDMVSMGRNPHLGRFQGLGKKDRDIVEKALATTHIGELRDRYVNELSGGEGQLTIVARALATEALILLLDEPTSDLDIRHALTIMELLAKLKEKGKTILVTIHDLNLARRYCDTISIIDKGSLFFMGSPVEAFTEDKIKQVFGVSVAEVSNNGKSFLYFYQ